MGERVVAKAPETSTRAMGRARPDASARCGTCPLWPASCRARAGGGLARNSDGSTALLSIDSCTTHGRPQAIHRARCSAMQAGNDLPAACGLVPRSPWVSCRGRSSETILPLAPRLMPREMLACGPFKHIPGIPTIASECALWHGRAGTHRRLRAGMLPGAGLRPRRAARCLAAADVNTGSVAWLAPTGVEHNHKRPSLVCGSRPRPIGSGRMRALRLPPLPPPATELSSTHVWWLPAHLHRPPWYAIALDHPQSSAKPC